MAKSKYERSSDYRKNFFIDNKGLLGTNKYQCAYCGRIKDKKKIQVDHYIPVHRVKHFGLGRIFMRIKGIKDINSTKNLLPACKKCNQKKSSKMGLWLIKGFFGRHFWWWLIVWTIRLLLIIGLIYIIILIKDGYNIFENINIEPLNKIGDFLRNIAEKIKEVLALS